MTHSTSARIRECVLRKTQQIKAAAHPPPTAPGGAKGAATKEEMAIHPSSRAKPAGWVLSLES
jgi:hypothetical protein